MASTYSNLKIQLMTTGENSTTWGDVTNLNLGTAIEEAIAGSADVTFSSANVTLTLTDTNSSQTARNMRLRCTGTTGGATRNLVVPSIEKPYIVSNGCADSIVVKTSAGTGITVPAGKTMWVFSDGTNVVDVTTHLTSLTVAGDVTVSGTLTANLNASTVTSGVLAVTYGGTGASTNASARVNLLPSYTGNAGKILALNAGGTDTEWVSAGGSGTVTSVNASGGTTGMSFSGGPVTSAGTLTLAGTLVVANGGTGATTLTSGAVIVGNGTSAVSSVSPGTTGNVLTSNGSAWVSQAGGGGGVTTITFGSTGLTPATATNGAVTVSGTLALTNGGTGATSASAARTALDVPSNSGTGATGTWAINVSGSAASVATTNYSVVQSGAYLYIKYGSTNICRIDSSGNAVFAGNVTGYGSI